MLAFTIAGLMRWPLNTSRQWGWARGRTGSRRDVVVRRLAVHPFVAPPIPRSPVIVVIPIVRNGELYDGHTQTRCVGVQRNEAALILINDIRRINPAAIVCERDVTPAPVIEATHDLNRRVR